MEEMFTILGGMGTAATETFVHLIDELTPAKKDQDYLNYVVFNHAEIPDRTAYILDNSQENPLPVMLKDIRQMNLLAPKFMVMTCNTAHYFYDELQAAADFDIIHMPRETVKHMQQTIPGLKKIGVLSTTGTRQAGIYQKAIAAFGLESVVPDQTLQDATMSLIYDDIKATGTFSQDKYQKIVDTMLNDYDCDAVILGCTELSVAQSEFPLYPDKVIDPMTVVGQNIVDGLYNK
ncbi:amino acid racemase [Latilactobacillus curvatus]|uniref:amino acid racemase n=1 Tax=Latilactobacillus curvatus TaxID=28038 RepID=UPI0020C80C3F|nr:amino acid racemase [Latilactobacillus curvatus]MCP8861537.1 amino acid racemase [Latilactobacillus curvatus]MCP8867667.1 amino acid racemase [Latilactobacillus curvatus]MCP8871249.1 amino acid racemase [Latilactobacillus curvatus]MCP8880236.1 amino acid racemase [Latilactobacillus curvatus]